MFLFLAVLWAGLRCVIEAFLLHALGFFLYLFLFFCDYMLKSAIVDDFELSICGVALLHFNLLLLCGG